MHRKKFFFAAYTQTHVILVQVKLILELHSRKCIDTQSSVLLTLCKFQAIYVYHTKNIYIFQLIYRNNLFKTVNKG